MHIYKLKALLFVLGFMSTTAVFAQSSITLDASQLYSSFEFKDSQGEVDKGYLPIYSGLTLFVTNKSKFIQKTIIK